MGSKEFAILAQEIEPLLEGSDQILAIIDVLITVGKHVNNNWYSNLQIETEKIEVGFVRKKGKNRR